MRWYESGLAPMSRIAVVARAARLRDALVRVADAGIVEFDRVAAPADLPVSEAARALQRLSATGPLSPRLVIDPPDLVGLEKAGRRDLLAGEVALGECAAQAVVQDNIAALLGWAPTDSLPSLARDLSTVGAAAAALPAPRGVQPPTAPRRGRVGVAFSPLVDTYGNVPYRDVDPSIAAGLAYVLMFGAMFGDVGHGALLVVAAILIRVGLLRRPWIGRLQPHALLIAAAGIAAMVFGLVYGECFGPTGIVGPGLVAPIEQPLLMLIGGIALGAVLLTGAYAVGTVNRLREGGLALALYAPAGIAGTAVFASAAMGMAAWYWHLDWLGLLAAVLAAVGLALAFIGLRAEAGKGAAGITQALVESFDLVVRLGANVVSFARLAAFGITHAVLGLIVWEATVGLWSHGPVGAFGAVIVFIVGNALAFGLEALVAGIQALRLEYYELFSRVFQAEGRPFRPWHVPLERHDTEEEASCRPGYEHSPSSV
jgi:V/A-type H+-transporting ATPase subunit I